MSEENTELNKAEGKEIPEGHPSWTPAEERALANGWRPLDEWEGEEDDWVDAKQFNIKGEMMDRITQQGKQIGAQKDELEALRKIVRGNNEMTRRIVEKTYERAVRELRAEKMEAVRDGDTERMVAIEEEMDDLKKQHDEANVAAEEATTSADVQQQVDYASLSPQQRAWVDYVATTDWIKEPAHYNGALAFADSYLNENPGVDTGTFISELNEYGKRARAVSRPTPAGPDKPASAGRQKVARGKKGFTADDLDDMQRSIGEEFVAMGDFKSLDEYAESLGKTGAL